MNKTTLDSVKGINLEQTEGKDEAWCFLEEQALTLDSELTPNAANKAEVEKENAQDPETSELLAPVIKITADLIAPNWSLTKIECEQLGEAYGALLDKYLPENGLNNYGVEIAALLTTGIIFSDRKGLPMRKPKKKDKQKVTENYNKNQTNNGVLMPKAVIDV